MTYHRDSASSLSTESPRDLAEEFRERSLLLLAPYLHGDLSTGSARDQAKAIQLFLQPEGPGALAVGSERDLAEALRFLLVPHILERLEAVLVEGICLEDDDVVPPVESTKRTPGDPDPWVPFSTALAEILLSAWEDEVEVGQDSIARRVRRSTMSDDAVDEWALLSTTLTGALLSALEASVAAYADASPGRVVDIPRLAASESISPDEADEFMRSFEIE